jgi:DNA-binding transcriptional ArsR family regulator
VEADVDVAAVAALIGDTTRAAVLLALTEADQLPASELARRTQVSAPTMSAHLAKLRTAGLIAVEHRADSATSAWRATRSPRRSRPFL